MLKAFDKIKKSVIINERAAVEILTIFPTGDEKRKLFRTIISGNVDYLTTLFLRSVDRRMAELLMYDIVGILFSGSKEVRVAAMKALASFGNFTPETVVLMAMEDSEWEVRAVAAKSMGYVKSKKTSEALYKALFDRQWWVRQNAANALAHHDEYEGYFIRAAESGDKFALDSIINALEGRTNKILLDYCVNRRAELINVNEEKK
jgi:hypothetical protein